MLRNRNFFFPTLSVFSSTRRRPTPSGHFFLRLNRPIADLMIIARQPSPRPLCSVRNGVHFVNARSKRVGDESGRRPSFEGLIVDSLPFPCPTTSVLRAGRVLSFAFEHPWIALRSPSLLGFTFLRCLAAVMAVLV